MHRRLTSWSTVALALLASPLGAEGEKAPAEAAPPQKVENASDWPGFLGPNRDGRSPETGLSFDWPVGGPPVLWHVEAGEGYGAPSVAGGRVFFFDRHGDRARLSAFEAETGRALWRSGYPTTYVDSFQFSGGPRASPVVDGGRVYTFGVEGRLRCHNVSDGELLWEVDTAAEFGVVTNFFGVGSTPWIEGGLLIAIVGGSPPGSPRVHSGKVKPAGSAVVAFDKTTGAVRYRTGDELAGYASPIAADLGGRRLGLAFARGGLLAFEPGDGKVAFHFPWRSPKLYSVNAATPVVAGNRVLISEGYGPGSVLLEVGRGGVREVWRDPPRGQSLLSHWATPIHHEGFVYGVSGNSGSSAELRCVELATGEVRWSHKGLRLATLVYADGHLLALSEHGPLTAVEATPEAYRQVAQVTLEEPKIERPAWNAPVLSRGLLYLRGKDRLVCLDLRPRLERSAEAR